MDQAEQASVPTIPTAKVLNRLGIRSAHSGDETVEELVNALSSTDSTRRVAALQALGKRAEQGVQRGQLPVAAVVAAMHDPEWSVRAMAALTLRLGGEHTPLAPLLDALHDEDESVRAAAARTLGAMGDRVPLQALEETLYDAAWRVREATILALGELGKRVPAEVLLIATQDNDEAVREAAEIALRQLYSDSSVIAHLTEQKSAHIQNPRQIVEASNKQRPPFVKRSLSRRTIAVILAVAAAIIIAGSSIIWSLLLRSSGNGQQVQLTPTKAIVEQLAFYGPGYSVVDSSGNLYVMDSDFQQTHTRILKFSSSGNLLNEWQHFTTGTQPLYIVIDKQDNIYATAQGSNTIYKLSTTGAILRKWQVAGSSGPLGSSGAADMQPVGLALDKQGNLYVAVYGGNTVQKYSPTGKLLAIWGTLGNKPGQFDHPVGVAVDAQGNIYVADQGNNRIQKLSPTGKLVAYWGSSGAGPGQFLQPGSIAVDTRGNVYVADGSSGLVQQFSSAGNLLAVWGAGGSGTVQFGTPRGVAVDTAGNIYVASVDLNGAQFVNGRITKLSSTGKLLAIWK
jgi:streptogramin lyase